MNEKGFGARKFFVEQGLGICGSIARHEEVHANNIILAKGERLLGMSIEVDRSCTVVERDSSLVFRNFTDLTCKKNPRWRVRDKRCASPASGRDSIKVSDRCGVDGPIHFLSSTTAEESKDSFPRHVHPGLVSEKQKLGSRPKHCRSNTPALRKLKSKVPSRADSAPAWPSEQKNQKENKETGPPQILRRSIKVDENFAIHPLREKSPILSKTSPTGIIRQPGVLGPEHACRAYNYILGAARRFIDINLPYLSPEKPKVCMISMEQGAAVITCHVPTALFEGLHYDCETIGEASQIDKMQQ